MTTVPEIFEKMPASFQRDAAVGMNVVIQFDISGEGGGKWIAAIENGELRVVEGAHEAPKLTISATAQDYIDISTGKLNEQLAFMTGRIKAKGDMLLAMKLPKIFKRSR
jgi:putative sterol carrier protein